MLQFSVPSKTFLVGEYAVLHGGPGILLATRPRFRLRAQMRKTSGTDSLIQFHPFSPAGRWLSSRWDAFRNWNMKFFDPYEGQGGFGASSAQFLLILALFNHFSSGHASLDPENVWRGFRDLYQSQPPSGADLMAQLAGQVTWFEPSPFFVDSHPWRFADLDFVLIQTGKKINTHDHLKTLKHFSAEEPTHIVTQVGHALDSHDSNLLVEGVHQYRQWLRSNQFEAAHTTEIVESLLRLDHVVAAKGCGALGSDVVLALVLREGNEQLTQWLEQHHLQIASTTTDLSEGLSLDEGGQS